MFKFFKKFDDCDLYSPVDGRQIPLSEVNDAVFSKKIIGDGVAFILEEDTLYAPCSGEIILVAETKHAIGIKTQNGMEVLIHVGMNTISLEGEGFEVLANKHEKVRLHQPLIKINRRIMEEKGMDLTTPMIITNYSDYNIKINENDDVNSNNIIIHATRK